MNAFLDSSALAKRYIRETGSDRVNVILASATALGISMIAVPEVISALCRLRREGKLTPDKYTEIRRAWLTHVEDAGVMPVNSAVIARAIELLERFPLRSSDAIQVASALEWSADCFISADERQCAAAKACGLKVERLR